jgi:hypothetical protein
MIFQQFPSCQTRLKLELEMGKKKIATPPNGYNFLCITNELQIYQSKTSRDQETLFQASHLQMGWLQSITKEIPRTKSIT